MSPVLPFFPWKLSLPQLFQWSKSSVLIQKKKNNKSSKNKTKTKKKTNKNLLVILLTSSILLYWPPKPLEEAALYPDFQGFKSHYPLLLIPLQFVSCATRWNPSLLYQFWASATPLGHLIPILTVSLWDGPHFDSGTGITSIHSLMSLTSSSEFSSRKSHSHPNNGDWFSYLYLQP